MESTAKKFIDGLVKQKQHFKGVVFLWSQNLYLNSTKLSGFNSVFLPILTCGHELLVMIENECYHKYKQKRWDFCEEFAA